MVGLMGEVSKTGNGRSSPGQTILKGLPLGMGIVIGLTASDATRESLGRWASAGVGMVAAALAALATTYLVGIWQRRVH
jgi:hypothetical protein